MKTIRTRFAPSPTGFMHVGNLRTALYAYLFAKQNNGDFILRIEDTDLERYIPGALDVIYATLKEANIVIDEGPLEGGEYGPYTQSERKAIYHEYAQKLIDNKHAYYCFCTKERLENLSDDKGIKKYDKHCLSLSAEEIEEKLNSKIPYVIRQNMPTTGISEFNDLVFGHVSIDNKELEDQVLIKSDGMPTYNFANVVDDHLMKITHVIRGNEYLSSTPKYNHLYHAFGWEIPSYMHLTPIMKDETRKLSKRYGDANFDDFVKKGYLPHAIINYIALLGWSPKENKEKFSMDELIEKFSISGLSKSGSIFDENKMKWLNSEYIKELDFDTFMNYAIPYFEQSKIKGKYDYYKFGKVLQSRIEIFSEIPQMVEFIVNYHKFDSSYYYNEKMKLDPALAKIILSEALNTFKKLSIWNEDSIKEAAIAISEKLALKIRLVYTVLRISLTGVMVSPGGALEMANILGKDESIVRLQKSLEWLES